MAKITGLFKRAGVGTWQYDFQLRGHRFFGSTGATNRRDAERWLTEFKKKKSEDGAQLAGLAPMTFGVASTRWWDERGQHRKGTRNAMRHLAWLQAQIGLRTMLRTIDNNIIALLVTKRRAEGASPATVNRSVIGLLRAIMNRAKVWDQPISRVDWNDHLLKEPQERVREMTQAEEERLFEAIRDDLHPILHFLVITGLRRAEACALKWADVDLVDGRMIVRGKGGSVVTLPLPDSALEILRGELGKHPEFVFTMTYKKERHGHIGGACVPILPATLGLEFWQARKAAGLTDLRVHDLRHTAATRMLRATGNLAIVQKMLRHSRITTTTRYAHVADADLLAAMNTASPTVAKSPEKSPTEPVKKLYN